MNEGDGEKWKMKAIFALLKTGDWRQSLSLFYPPPSIPFVYLSSHSQFYQLSPPINKLSINQSIVAVPLRFCQFRYQFEIRFDSNGNRTIDDGITTQHHRHLCCEWRWIRLEREERMSQMSSIWCDQYPAPYRRMMICYSTSYAHLECLQRTGGSAAVGRKYGLICLIEGVRLYIMNLKFNIFEMALSISHLFFSLITSTISLFWFVPFSSLSFIFSINRLIVASSYK